MKYHRAFGLALLPLATALAAAAQPGPGADQFIRPFGGRDVEHAGHQAAFDERFHRPPAGAGGVEDEHFVARALPGSSCACSHAGRRVAELAGDDDRLVSAPASGGRPSTMPQIAPAARREDLARDAVRAPPHRRCWASSRCPSRRRIARCCRWRASRPSAWENRCGSARIAAVAMAVPPPPPSEITPSMRSFALQLRQDDRRGLRHRRDGFARDHAARRARRDRCRRAPATSSREMSGASCGGPVACRRR